MLMTVYTILGQHNVGQAICLLLRSDISLQGGVSKMGKHTFVHRLIIPFLHMMLSLLVYVFTVVGFGKVSIVRIINNSYNNYRCI